MPPTLECPIEQLRRTAVETSQTLARHGIRHALWSGAHAMAIGGHRVSRDADFLVHDSDIHLVPELFPDSTLYRGHDRTIVTLPTTPEVELMAHMDIHTPDGVFPWRMTEFVLAHVQTLGLPGWESVPAVAPDETALLKAVLQRGPEVNKYDPSDARVMLAAGNNHTYHERRTQETGAGKRALPWLRGLQRS